MTGLGRWARGREERRALAAGNDPFAVLGLDAGADLGDDDVRAAWRRIAAETHPDRADGGDLDRFAVAAAAYTELRTRYGRGEARAALTSAARAGAGHPGPACATRRAAAPPSALGAGGARAAGPARRRGERGGANSEGSRGPPPGALAGGRAGDPRQWPADKICTFSGGMTAACCRDVGNP